MSEFSSYYLYQRYEKRGDQPWLPSYPNTLSIDGDGTMPLVVKEEDDPQCGYVPPLEPIYRWVDLDPTKDWFCSDCDTKVYGVHNSGETFSVQCNDNPTLTSGDVSSLTDIEYVLIGGCVTSIGDGALSGQTSLQGVTMPPSITSIGASAFNGDAAMTDCAIPNSVTSIGASAFTNCVSLQNVMLWDSITSIGAYAFHNCDFIISIHIPSGLTAITEGCFLHCGGLSEVNIPNSVTSIGNYAFEDCTSLFEVSIGSGVTSIGNQAFSGCNGLTRITCLAPIPPSLGSSVFNNTNNCPIYVPCESVHTYKYTNNWRVYADRIFGIPPCEPPSFDGKWLATYTTGTTSSAECDSSSAITQNEISKTDLVAVEIGDCVTSIGNSAFTNYYDLEEVIIPNSVTSIGTSAFTSCSSLMSITIPSGVTSIGDSVFRRCSGLTSIDIPSGVTSIGSSAFGNCTSLTSVTIPSGVTSIGGSAFYGCSGLTSVTVEAITPPSLDMYAFHNSTGTIYVPAASVNAYKTATNWSTYASRIQPITN